MNRTMRGIGVFTTILHIQGKAKYLRNLHCNRLLTRKLRGVNVARCILNDTIKSIRKCKVSNLTSFGGQF